MHTLKLASQFLVFSLLATSAFGQIVLREAREAPVPIAIQSFTKLPDNPDLSVIATDIEAALTADLIFSRIFKVIPADSFLDPKITGPLETINPESWRTLGAQYVVRGRVSFDGSSAVLEGFVFNIATAKLTLQRKYSIRRNESEKLAHMFGDDIVEIVTGMKGLFSTKIAFAYTPPGKSRKEIWVIDFNGKNAQPLVQNDRMNLSPEWTVDGKNVYFTSSSISDWHLWKTDLRGKQSQVTRFKGSALGPAMLPNGRELLISLSKDGNNDIYLLKLDGSVVRRLTSRRGINIAPYASPDGKKFCFSSDRFGNLHVFAMEIDTGVTERLTRVGTLNDSCAWNPRDDLILFSGMDTDREFDIFAMNSMGQNMERLTYDAKNNESPSWSPDGKLVVFSSRRGVKNQIFVMKADGTQVLPLVELPGDASQPSWSPRLGYR